MISSDEFIGKITAGRYILRFYVKNVCKNVCKQSFRGFLPEET